MKLFQAIKIMALLTLGAIGYIHLQMKIIDLAYQGKVKEMQIRDLMERNGNATYDVLSLKSSSYLQEKLLDKDSNMQFADPKNIVRLSSFSDDENTAILVAQNEEDLSLVPVVSLLSLKLR